MCGTVYNQMCNQWKKGESPSLREVVGSPSFGGGGRSLNLGEEEGRSPCLGEQGWSPSLGEEGWLPSLGEEGGRVT